MDSEHISLEDGALYLTNEPIQQEEVQEIEDDFVSAWQFSHALCHIIFEFPQGAGQEALP